jgi:Arc/MetJ-type ribon-helix-helix transcriptional regulator
MPDVEAHEAMKLKLLQQAIDEGLASGPSDRSMEELIADAEGEMAADGPAGDA